MYRQAFFRCSKEACVLSRSDGHCYFASQFGIRQSKRTLHNNFAIRHKHHLVPGTVAVWYRRGIPALAFFTTTTTSSKTGDEVYNEYLQLCQELENLRQEKERQKSQAMYEAWQRTEERELANKKSQGVAVVKTLVKQTRKELKQKQQPELELQEKAQARLQEAALQLGYAPAIVQLGNQALADASKQVENAKEHIEMALELYQRAGLSGSKEGWFNHGHLLWTGFPDQTEQDDMYTDTGVVLAPNQEKALESFEKATQLGDVDAMYFMGVQLLSLVEADDESIDTARDPRMSDLSRGLRLVQDAAAEGHGGALYYLALFHLGGHVALGIPPCSPQEFRKKLDAAVAAENEDALFLRGHSLYHGENGYPRNLHLALGDFLKAADAGHADAAVSAGAMLHSGDGVPKDQNKAFELYQHAGELGNLEGWRNVAACYATGEGVAQSLEMAKHITKTMRLAETGESP
eukprot:scaffold34597_cov177-Amphora_coffeaeformis.AAC.28